MKNISGKNANAWKGERAGYSSRHSHLVRAYGKPNRCDHCLGENAKCKDGRNYYHWANISGKYLRERSDWKMLCVRCHKLFDKQHWISSLPRGEKHVNSKLNQFQVRRIRLIKEIIPKITCAKLGKLFNVKFQTIAKILSYNSWKHI